MQNPKAGKSRNLSGVQIVSVRRTPPIVSVHVSHVSAPAISADSIAGEPLNATAALRIRGGIPKRTQIAWTLTIGRVRRTETI